MKKNYYLAGENIFYGTSHKDVAQRAGIENPKEVQELKLQEAREKFGEEKMMRSRFEHGKILKEQEKKTKKN